MILPVLVLGNGRYLDVGGEILPAIRSFSDEDVEFHRTSLGNADFDPEIEGAPTSAVRLTDDNREMWEMCAARGGHNLADILA